MDALLELRSTLNKSIGKEGQQLGVYELVLKAAAAAMKAVPSANASWMDSVVRVYDSVDINVVVGNGVERRAPGRWERAVDQVRVGVLDVLVSRV